MYRYVPSWAVSCIKTKKKGRGGRTISNYLFSLPHDLIPGNPRFHFSATHVFNGRKNSWEPWNLLRLSGNNDKNFVNRLRSTADSFVASRFIFDSSSVLRYIFGDKNALFQVLFQVLFELIFFAKR